MNRPHLALAPAALVLLAFAAGCTAGADGSGASGESDLTAATSGYTSLTLGTDCPALPAAAEQDGPVDARFACAGMGGYSLIDTVGDERDFVSIKIGNKEIDLDYASKLKGGFSHLGPKAEWRGPQDASGVHPYAVIFRYFEKTSETTETNYLMVARLDGDKVCFIDAVDGTKANGNVAAREVADAHRNTPCPGAAGVAVQNADSIYTPLQNCTVTEQGKQDWSVSDCGGSGGYKVIDNYGDGRDTVVVKSATNTSELNHRVTGGFSHLGPKAEWRISGPQKTVHALVFRFFEEAYDDKGTATEHQYMVVAKVTPQGSCVTDMIDVKKHAGDHNVLAREAADLAPTKACSADSAPTPR